MSDDVTQAVEEFDTVSLDELDARASLLRRVDHKYALSRERLMELLDRLRSDHQVLEIDGRRVFSYCSTYFDTPELRCFTDHVEARQPRFKARTRLYVDTDSCVFEVKLKREEGETDKHQVEHRPQDADRLTDAARRCLEDVLRDAGLEAPESMAPTLRTTFRRVTVASREGAQRLTCDLAVALTGTGGGTARLRDGLVLLETKSEDGESPADRLLAGAGMEPISLSKYRVGVGLVGPAPGLVAAGASGEAAGHLAERAERASQPGSELFVA